MLFSWIAVLAASTSGLGLRLVWRRGAPSNSPLIFAGIALTLGYAVLYRPLYEQLAQLLHGPNFPDLVAKATLFLAFGILGTKIAAALNDRRAVMWIGGIPGLIVALALFTGVLVSFGLVRAGQPSPLLADYQTQPAVIVYTALTLLYTSYVSSWLILPLAGIARQRVSRTIRIAACAILTGLVCVLVRFACVFVGLAVPAAFDFGQAVAAIGAVCVVAGLGLTAFAARRGRPQTKTAFLESDARE